MARPERGARPVPITAWSAATGLGRDTAQTMRAIFASERPLSRPPHALPFETVCGIIPGELPAPPAALRVHDTRLCRAALLACEPIAAQVQAAVRRWGPGRVALLGSTSTGGIAETERAYFAFRDRGTLPEGYDYDAQHVFDAFLRVLRATTGIEGPSHVVSTACSSSAKIFGAASRWISSGVVDAALLVGVDTLCLTTLRGFHSLGVLSPVPCRPFGRDRPGMNIGEGAAAVLVEREGDARALLLGVGESSDAFHMSAPHPEGRGALEAMRAALAQAGLRPEDVDHVNAHGTGTQANDIAESQAIVALLGGRVPVCSTKGYTGHTLGAAGAVEAVIALESMGRGVVPASAGSEPVDLAIGARVTCAHEPARLRRVLSNSFAFGGNNVSLLFGEAA